jgi:hypothetical protein
MSAVSEVIAKRSTELSPRHRRMAEVFASVLESRTATDHDSLLSYGQDLVRAFDRGEPIESLLEEAYRSALILSDPRREWSEPPHAGQSWDDVVMFTSEAQIRQRSETGN